MVLRRIKDRVRERLHVDRQRGRRARHLAARRARLRGGQRRIARKALELLDDVVRVAMSAGGAQIVGDREGRDDVRAPSVAVRADRRSHRLGRQGRRAATTGFPTRGARSGDAMSASAGSAQGARRARHARGADRDDRRRRPAIRACTRRRCSRREGRAQRRSGGRATCYVSIVGDDATADAALEGLQKAAGFLRGRSAARLGLQHAPELRFLLDPSIDMSEKLAAIVREDEERARAAGREPRSRADAAEADAAESTTGRGTGE